MTDEQICVFQVLRSVITKRVNEFESRFLVPYHVLHVKHGVFLSQLRTTKNFTIVMLALKYPRPFHKLSVAKHLQLERDNIKHLKIYTDIAKYTWCQSIASGPNISAQSNHKEV